MQHIIQMKQHYKIKLPEWTNLKKEDKYKLILSNDLDSFISCKLLEKMFGFKIGYFFDFNSLYKLENVDESIESIGVDIALNKGKTFDNHVSCIHIQHDTFNPNSANINNIEKIYGASDIYFSKYCGSTLLQIMSIYNIPIPEDIETMLLLLSIDSTMLGYYSKYGIYRDSNKKYLVDVLEFPQLYELQKQVNISEYSNVIRWFNLKTNLSINEKGRLISNQNLFNLQMKLHQTMNLNLSFPDSKFHKIQSFNCLNMNIPRGEDLRDYTKEKAKELGNDIYSLAVTGKYNITLSYKEKNHLSTTPIVTSEG